MMKARIVGKIKLRICQQCKGRGYINNTPMFGGESSSVKEFQCLGCFGSGRLPQGAGTE